MAKSYNDINKMRTARYLELTDNTPTPEPIVQLVVSKTPAFAAIDVAGVTYSPIWNIDGLLEQRVDLFEPAVIEQPLERWVGRVRPVGFPLVYENLDSLLDADLITFLGITLSPSEEIPRWRGG